MASVEVNVEANHVVLFVRGWKGDSQVPLKDSTCSLLSFLTINGFDVHPQRALLDMGSGHDFLTLELHGLPDEEVERFPLERVLMGSTREVVQIPVGRLEIQELKS